MHSHRLHFLPTASSILHSLVQFFCIAYSGIILVKNQARKQEKAVLLICEVTIYWRINLKLNEEEYTGSWDQLIRVWDQKKESNLKGYFTKNENSVINYHPHVDPNRKTFVHLRTQIKIFLMKSESFLTLHRQQQQPCSSDNKAKRKITLFNNFLSSVSVFDTFMRVSWHVCGAADAGAAFWRRT